VGHPVIEAKRIRKENAKVEVLRAYPHETTRCLREQVQGAKAELVSNLDDVGMSEWEDRREKKVIAPPDDEQTYDISSRIKKCQTHIDNHMYHCWRRVSGALHSHVAGLRCDLQEADA
jgi:hypothetical protein